MAILTNGGRADFVCDRLQHRLTVHIRGEIDHHTAAAIREGVDALLFEWRPETLVLDLSAVSFMDSSGLGLIMGRYAVMKELGGAVTVYNPGPETYAILKLGGLERIVRIEFSPDALFQGDGSAGEKSVGRPAGRPRGRSGAGTAHRVRRTADPSGAADQSDKADRPQKRTAARPDGAAPDRSARKRAGAKAREEKNA